MNVPADKLKYSTSSACFYFRNLNYFTNYFRSLFIQSAEIAEESFCFSLVFRPGMGPVGAGTLDLEATAELEQQVRDG